MSAYFFPPDTTLRAQVSALHRPAMLLRAARFGLQDYRRTKDLRRLGLTEATVAATVRALLLAEERCEMLRQRGDLGYSPAHHIDILIALLSQAALLPRPAPHSL